MAGRAVWCIRRRNICNLRYVHDAAVIANPEAELKQLLDRFQSINACVGINKLDWVNA